jgi:hypothetical protein
MAFPTLKGSLLTDDTFLVLSKKKLSAKNYTDGCYSQASDANGSSETPGANLGCLEDERILWKPIVTGVECSYCKI